MSLSLCEADAIILAGGQSRRMGAPKALLPWGQGALVQATVESLSPHFRRVIVVARPGQSLPPVNASVVYDAMALGGPMVGLASGLAASDAPWCFVAGCDMPFLDRQVVERMALWAEGCDIVLLRSGGLLQPLHAWYSERCLVKAEALLKRGVTSLRALLEGCHLRILEEAALGEAGQARLSAVDIDTPDSYLAAWRLAQRLPQEARA
ncbi:MAG: molybdenum cofactor guanylyltransferase [Chloroflexi bacterium]|nr:molybdenum cofactor guanylyltransferase [Chloroflexota bacterium]